eukprot:TRINITY_DN34636_c0_g1_i1.p1 TRINITY_DN34636_c0_g1~~TRINITY_DN34636_c0_g1_i1.p1  ORF type:complete len:771 (+),score=107.57 TRINITY_DN34636_c0_g1_i1:230-2314(+)
MTKNKPTGKNRINKKIIEKKVINFAIHPMNTNPLKSHSAFASPEKEFQNTLNNQADPIFSEKEALGATNFCSKKILKSLQQSYPLANVIMITGCPIQIPSHGVPDSKLERKLIDSQAEVELTAGPQYQQSDNFVIKENFKELIDIKDKYQGKKEEIMISSRKLLTPIVVHTRPRDAPRTSVSVCKERQKAETRKSMISIKKQNLEEPLNYLNHPFNVKIPLINKLNKEISLKSKDGQFNLKNILQLITKLKLKIKRPTSESLKQKESINELKEKLVRLLHQTINTSNSLNVELPRPQISNGHFIVNLGNNHPLVRSIMKDRWWWGQAADEASANIVWSQWRKIKFIKQLPKLTEYAKNPVFQLCNHLEGNFQLGNKKGLFHNLKLYYQLINFPLNDVIPETYHITKGRDDPEYANFLARFNEEQERLRQEGVSIESDNPEDSEEDSSAQSEEEIEEGRNIWIVKPGENSNRGVGIKVTRSIREINLLISHSTHTFIIQKYIERPLLINRRKFDIRCFALVTSVCGHIKGYYYPEGYLRTSSSHFTLSRLSQDVHLTNEAIQVQFEDFGRFEAGNKISYAEFQTYLDAKRPGEIDINTQILPTIKRIITDTLKSTYLFLDPHRRIHTFELFGYDIMIDDDFKVYLIEANINPCLTVSSAFSAKFIPALVDNTLRIALDPLFPPPADFSFSKKKCV